MTPPPYTRVLPQSAEPIYDLTVITVCRDVLPQLKRTTASVLGQKAVYPDVSIEHVIVDGASTDGTPEWLAEMKAQGKIETYISEPDRGIYDAMNKGINLAKGRSVLFLNADDVLTHVDLTACVQPIIEGKCRLCGAITARTSPYLATDYEKPDFRRLYLYGPVAHQGFIAETALLRELGGYDAAHYICMADTELMTRCIISAGFPHVIESVITEMPQGGFSRNGYMRFCDEYIETTYRNRERIYQLCSTSSDYTSLIVHLFLTDCLLLRRWHKSYAADNRNIDCRIEHLKSMCKDLAQFDIQAKQRRALHFAANVFLPEILQKKACSILTNFRLRRHARLCKLPPESTYHGIVRGPRISFTNDCICILKRLCPFL